MRMTAADDVRVFFSMIELEIRRVMHDRTEIYARAVQPLLWLLIFGHVVGTLKAIPTGGTPYLDFIMPGVLIQSTMAVSIFFGLIIIWERESGVLKRLMTTPAPRYAIVVGRSMAAGVRGLAQAAIIIPFALLLGVPVILNPLTLLATLVIVFISSGGFAAVSIMIAALLKTRERFIGIGQAVVLPLFFASNALYPLSAMPPLLQAFALVNPMTYMVDAARALLITGDLAQLPLDFAVIIVFDVFMFAAASFTFKNVME